MHIYYYNGVKYLYNNGKWFTTNYTTVPTSLVSKLNQLVIKEDKLEDKSINELKTVIDGARKVENYQLAAQALEVALTKASVDDIRSLLPRLTSNLRKIGMPQKAIDVNKEYTSAYGKQIYSQALFTSIAAAYCDIDEYETAKKFADIAKARYNETSPELISVYARIKKWRGEYDK